MIEEIVHSYSKKAEKVLPMFGTGSLKFGVELEVEVKSQRVNNTDWWRAYENEDYCGKIAKDVYKIFNSTPNKPFVICKDDGSLDNGFEIVTAPATFEEQVKHWQLFFEQVKSLKIKTLPTCGMHVHFSRKATTIEEIRNIVEFITEKKNRSFIVKIAGRKNPEFASMRKKLRESVGHKCDGGKYVINPGYNEVNSFYIPRMTWIPGKCSSRDDHYEVQNDRHDAVNITNEKTIEIRIFKSTLKPGIFFKNLEFVHACIMWAKSPDWKIDVKSFKSWLGDQHYPALKEFITNKKL